MASTIKRSRTRVGLMTGMVLVLALLAVLPAQVIAASNSLDNVSFAALPGERIQVKLSMSGPAAEPASFTIDNPARIALDFADTANSLAAKTQSIGLGVARSLSAVEAQGRTRVVLNLSSLVPYEVAVSGNDVLVTLEGTGTGATRTKADTYAPPSSTAAAGGRGVQDVDFRRGENGEGRIVVTLSDPSIPVDVRQEGTRLIVDFVSASLPEQLERRLDVLDFATPVKMIDTYARGNDVRLTVEPVNAEYDHLAYQSDTTFTLEVQPLTKEEKAERKKDKFGYVGERLSLNFQSIEVRAVLQLLADFAGFNLVTSDTVTGTVTLRLKNVPWDQALDIILQTKGLDKRQTGNVMLVAPTEEIAAREKLELESQIQLEELKPLRSEIIEINYAKATDIADLLEETRAGEGGDTRGGQDRGVSLLSERGTVIPDERTNSLLVSDTVEKIEEIRDLVAILDEPVRQVLIESRIVIASNDFSKDLGVRFGVSNSFSSGSSQGVIGGSNTGYLESQDPPVFPGFIDEDDNEGLIVDLPVANPAGALSLVVGKIGSYLLQLELSALQQEGRGEVISNPRVITANGKEALIKQGTEIPFLEASSSGAAAISFKEAVLSLKVTPQITPEDNVIMDLVVTQDSVGEEVLLLGSQVPSIDTQEVTTRVLVDNGETVVLGGIYKQEIRDGYTKVPFFGDLPYVGWAFRNRTQTDNKDELLVFVTPKILSSGMLEKAGQLQVGGR